MRRFLAFVVLFLCSLPVGLSIAGCGHNPNNYCIKNGNAYGITTSQVVYITLQPETTGLSLAWGQTGNIGAPQAFNCNGGSASVSKYTYASSNLQLADISPTGIICAGTWNRNSPGGVSNFTICTPPPGSSLSSFSGCTPTTCGTVQITASGAAVTSNPVNIYVHPPITSMTIPSQTKCVSQGQTLADSSGATLPLLAETTVTGPGGVTLCSPSTISCTSPNANVGTITYNPVTSSVVTINNTTNPTSTNPVTGTTTNPTPNPNGTATANLPGSTIINANTSEVTSAAGYFSTCPPATIKLNINGSTSATVTPSSPQTVVSQVTDTNGATINGLSLSYASTEPQNLSVSSTGLITASFPSHATVSAICQPPSCNPAPVNLIGTLGNGMPVTGNIVTVNSPGPSSNQIWMASSQSPYFSEVDLTTGGAAAPVRLPYTPNSMVMNQGGTTLYFGSYYELMIYNTLGNSLSKEVTSVPGVVLAVSPAGSTVVINDQLRQVIYLYSTSASSYTSIGGVASRAQFSPDGTTVYISGQDPVTGQNTLFVNNSSSGWSSYPLNNQPAYSCPLEAAGSAEVPAYNPSWDPFCGPSLTITVPSVAAFLSGTSTAARSFCPNSSANPPYYPPAADVNATTTQLTATPDGNHILGTDGTTFSDIWLFQGNTPSGATGVPIGACPAYGGGTPLTLTTSFAQGTLPVSPSEVDEVVSSPDSSVAFVTYNAGTAAGLLPYYRPSSTAGALGAVGTLQLSSGALAPFAGIFSPDGSIFFTSTSGDNLVHMVNTTTLTDTQTINPNLTNGKGVTVPAQFLAVKSRPTT
jgi:trimeric autotransporter adhesin